MAPRERFERESCRRAAAKPDHHVILDQLHCSLGCGTLESVLINTGRGRRRIHDITTAVATLAPKIAEPATIAVAPAATACAAVAAFSPPSTSITGHRLRSAHIARRRLILGSISGRKL